MGGGGQASEKRECCLERERGEENWVIGEGLRTRVVWRTLPSLGKSLTPESRMAMEDERREMLEWREETHEGRG